MNKLEKSIPTLLQEVIEAHHHPERELDKDSKKGKPIDELVEKMTTSLSDFTASDFKFLPLQVRLIIFNKLLQDRSSLDGLAHLIDSQVRRVFLSEEKYSDVQPILLTLMIKKDPEGKVTVDTTGLSQAGIESALDTLSSLEKTQVKHLVLSNSIELFHLDFLKQFLNLEILECQRCSQLRDIKGISHCQNLQTLDLSQCLSLTTLEGLKKSQQLKNLILEKCRQLKHYGLLPINELSNLEYLNISECFSIIEYSLIQWNSLKNLKVLNLQGNVHLPSLQSLASLNLLESIYLTKDNLKEDPTYHLPPSVTIHYS